MLKSTVVTIASLPHTPTRTPRLGGLFLRLARATTRLVLPFAGTRWFGFFSVVRHTGRRSGRSFEAPVAARRVTGGFVLALAFGGGAHWYQNLVAAGGGAIRWHGGEHPIGAPEAIDVETALAAFLPIQRAGLRLADVDGYIFVPDVAAPTAATSR
jgi:deazaflavin-dependent oxidoreductase (nitroreductase family)